MEKRTPNTADILAQARRQGATKAPEKIEPPLEDSLPISALHQAALNGDLRTVMAELAAGASLNQLDHQGTTPLSYALRREQLEVAHYLVDAGADVHCSDTDIPPLLEAIAANDCSLVEKMLARGADLQRQSGHDGSSALMMAESEEMIVLLAARGASFEARNNVGHNAVENCRFQAAAIRRREEERVKHYAKLGELTASDPKLREQLQRGLSEMSQEAQAVKYDQLAATLERYAARS